MHKIAVLTITYILGAISAIVSLLHYFEVDVSRPAFLAEVVQVDQKVTIGLSATKDSMTHDILVTKKEMYGYRLDSIVLEIANLEKELGIVGVSIENAGQFITNLSDKNSIIASYRREESVIRSVLAKLQIEKDATVEKIKKIEAQIK